MKDDDRYLEIGPSGERKRRKGMFLFLLFYVGVGAAFALLLYHFTRNWVLAVLLVGFMVSYMAVMGWAAMRNENDLDI
jgi:4-hydroxybenzoate polyprenyltransferase